MKLPSERFSGPEKPDTASQYERVRAAWEANPFRSEDGCFVHNKQLMIDILKPLDREPSMQFLEAVGNMTYGLYRYEGLYEIEEPSDYHLGIDGEEQQITSHASRLAEADRVTKEFFVRFFRHVPPEIALAQPTARTVALLELTSDPAGLIQEFYKTFAYNAAFPRTCGFLFTILARASGFHPEDGSKASKYVWPKDADLADLEDYYRDTAFRGILSLQVPFVIPERTRFEHTHVVAATGQGKTTLLTRLFIDDLLDPKEPAIIIIDGKGTWAPELQRFKIFAPNQTLSKRLQIINPADIEHAPALNMFHLRTIFGASHNTMVDSVASQLSYIFGSREFELSAKMRTAFTYAAQLVFSMPNSTLDTLIDLMRDPVKDSKDKTGGVREDSQFYEPIQKLPFITKQFLETVFYHPTEYAETKRQIQNRIYDLLSNAPFAAMFRQQENCLNILDIMQTGKILIVDAASVGEAAASSFGRYLIALTLSAAYARKSLPRESWRACWLYVDEAQLFVDEERTQPLLQQAREFNLGVTFAHQKLADLSPALRQTFAGNTSIKYCGGSFNDDAREFAPNMRTNAEFIFTHPKGSFATYVRGLTPRALTTSVQLGLIDKVERMTDAQYAELIARNRMIMSPPGRRPAPSTLPPSPAPSTPDEPRNPSRPRY